ncbi:hypothetical protein LTR02_018307, partial [Friedmanniomyces endolithicus]
EEFIAVLAAEDGLALHAEFEGVQWVDDGLGHHACEAASDELRGLRDVTRVVVAFHVGDGAFAGLGS